MSSIGNISSTTPQWFVNPIPPNNTSLKVLPGLPQFNIPTDTSTSTPQTDGTQLSPFAQVVSTLQHLQESDPAKYSAVAQQIANNLTTAAQNVTSGNQAATTQLTQLASAFTTASQNGKLPDLSRSGQVSGDSSAHHHRHSHAKSTDSGASANSASTSSSATSGSNGSGYLSQLLFSSFNTNGPAQDSPDALNIISKTLSGSGTGA